MSIVQFDRAVSGPSSWSLDASETGERTKCPWVGVVGLIAWSERAEKIFFPPAVPSAAPTHGHFVLSPVTLALRDPDVHLR